MPILILFLAILAAILFWYIRNRLKSARINRISHRPLSIEWITILSTNVRIYPLLNDVLKNELHGYINIFLDEKIFYGRDGIEINDEIRLTVAGNACLLLLQGMKNTFPGFTSILIYPDTYVAHQTKQESGLSTNEVSARAGESWMRGPVILSWADVVRGIKHPGDGHNVVIHEFAHKLDEQDGVMDGLPVLRDKSQYAEWAKVLNAEYVSLQERVKHGTNKVIDSYGAVSPPEFFAVVTESFFEKPILMKHRLPKLYEQLEKFYNIDPASWHHKK
ncbi:MAG: M90 family metallopeptidase [Pseudomonadota bacterium]